MPYNTAFDYMVVAICTFVGLMIGLFGHAVKNRETLSVDDWMWSVALCSLAGIVWPLTFCLAGFGTILYLLGAILGWLNRAFVGLLNHEKAQEPEAPAQDSESPYR